MRWKIRYNSPLILSFVIVALLLFLLKRYFPFIDEYFSSPITYPLLSFRDWDIFRLFFYPLNHADWNHLSHNMLFMLLLGPILEEKYGSFKLLLMFLLTSATTAIATLTVSATSLIGASGIVYMLILLISFTNFRRGEIPLTALIILLIFIGRELYSASILPQGDVSYLGHIIGGISGAFLGFLLHKSEPPKGKERVYISS